MFTHFCPLGTVRIIRYGYFSCPPASLGCNEHHYSLLQQNKAKEKYFKEKKKTLKKSTWLFQQLANLLEPFYEELEIFMFLKNIQK